MEDHFAGISRRLQAREHELKRAVAELEESRRAVLALRESWSWRLTAPLRATADLVLARRRFARGTGPHPSFRSKALGYLQWLRYGQQVRSSGLFDERHYLTHNPDVARSSGIPLRHFFVFGAAEGRNPHPLFDSRYYLNRNPDVVKSGINPLVHYLKWGASEGRDPHPAFDTSFYLESNPDVRKVGLNPLSHFMGPGVTQGLDPNPWFDTSEYLERHPDAALHGINPLLHYLEPRNAQLIRQSLRTADTRETTDLRFLMPFDPRTSPLRAALRKDHEALQRPPLNSAYDSIPLVSVVIACCDCGYYLEDAILSAMTACTYPMEIIVVDDGSTDRGSIFAVEELQKRYRFRLLRQARTGPAGARHNGLLSSRGRFIQFLDAPDILAPGKIDFQSDILTDSADTDIAICEYEFCDAYGGNRRMMEPSTLAGFEFSSEDFLMRWERGFFLPIDCALFRRELLGRNQFPPLPGEGQQDWVFWIGLAASSPRFRYHPEVMATCRTPDNNTFPNHEEAALAFLSACMHVVQTGLDTSDAFLETALDHFRKAYLESIKDEAIAMSRAQIVQ